MKNLNQTSKVFAALLIGSLIGATLGVLFAPHKGRKSRKMVVKGATNMTEDIKQTIKDTTSGIQKSVEEVLATTKTNAENVKKNVGAAINDLKQTY